MGKNYNYLEKVLYIIYNTKTKGANMEEKRCVSCRKIITDNDKTCPYCGSYTKIMLKHIVALVAFAVLIFSMSNIEKYIGIFILSLPVSLILVVVFLIDGIKSSSLKTRNGLTKQSHELTKYRVAHIEGLRFCDKNSALDVILEEKHIVFLQDSKPLNSVRYENIKDVFILEEITQEMKEKSPIARALVGGVLLGGVGAIVGGLSGVAPQYEENKKYYLQIQDNIQQKDIIICAKYKILEKIKNHITTKV